MTTSMYETHLNLVRWLEKPKAELMRKALKARRYKTKLVTWEDIDYSKAVGKEWAATFKIFKRRL